MKLPVDVFPARVGCAAMLVLSLGGCLASGSAANEDIASAAARAGPQGDYPLVVGEPYVVQGVSFEPADTLNYDEVGFVAADEDTGIGTSAAHHTLPLPSYAEVTSLETGRTILVRVERRGPMHGTDLVALSKDALAQLAAHAGTPVRVRRVNPPEDQRALLRAGGAAAPRMDTPMSLVAILRRKLPAVAAAPVAPPAAGPSVSAARAPAEEMTDVQEDGFIVQAAAFSTEERARNAAATLSGQVSHSGQFFRVRTGPFTSRSEAEASLAKIKAAGYTDARILKTG